VASNIFTFRTIPLTASRPKGGEQLRTAATSCTLDRPMQHWSHRPLLAGLGALACAAAVAMSLWPVRSDVRAEDQNGDGRADTWRHFDRQGELSEVTVDTNFDGKPDVHEYYERGALVRRESDRDFNDRVDLVQEFDAVTREHERSVVDVDFDGTADLLVLFQGGQPVLTKWAHRAPAIVVSAGAAPHAEARPRATDGQLAPLEDPFSSDLSVRAVRGAAGSGDVVGLSTSGGLPSSYAAIASPLAFSSDASAASFSNPSSAAVVPYSPRGPPASHLPS